ncbi:hypothetical protein [Verrucosispora sp. NA02020]|uniref:hypothetical protein n=1 Tax=Verrucosispora sp. NA02020 TaxID=2742132 RepID=UPI001590918C|nr:hypothetical protein [Verrucosispora sp. NA02020]QKW15469.1 hypothetical protein HUT12_23660 [Verrucosispora sp. NA02020]
MTPADWTTVALAPVTAATAVIAWLAWRTAKAVRRDQSASETRRRHREMRPTLDVTIEHPNGHEIGILSIKLTGPREVERYDRIQVRIRDDKERPPPRTGSNVTVEKQNAQVWGPFRFRHGVDGAREDGRVAEQGGKAVTDRWLFSLDRTTAPEWYGGGDPEWRRTYDGTPLRLRVAISRAGSMPWVELLEVPTAVGGKLMA